jgi:shikimate dehydrogenase
MLKANGIDVEGRKVMVLGSGGASLTVRTALQDLGAGEIVVISRNGENNYENIQKHFDSEVIINTTPVGMYPNNGRAPVNVEDFHNCQGVVDLIYNPNKTKLGLDAMAKSIPACGGLEMLVAQAKEASELFQGVEIEDEEIDAAYDEVRSEMLNTILIGMPGAGKSLIGGEIAARMGKKFVDIDDMIVEHEGMSIVEIFAQKGEAYFRKLETQMLEQACIQSGLVIGTGGGIVKKKINYNIIKQNGVVIWVKRDLDKLETDGRPLSMTVPVEQLWEERKDAYAYWSDFFINNNENRE